MKLKTIFLIIISFVATKNYCQITKTTIEVKEKLKEQLLYDGKSDFKDYKDVEQYKQFIGQKIYTTKSFSPIYKQTGESCNDYYNKYFIIKDVIKRKVRLSKGSEMAESDVFKLVNDENGETYFYLLDHNHKSIILVPYFLNLKKTYENKKFVISSYWRENGFQNEATNEWVVIDKKLYGGEWTCEVSVLEKDGQEKIFYIMKSNAGEIISSETIDDNSRSKFRIINKLGTFTEAGLFFMSIEDSNNEIAYKNKAKEDAIAENNNRIDKLTQKYGKDKTVLITNEKVEIGMTKAMCKESWGIPSKIDVTKTEGITKEIFIYSWSKRLYFENDKLVKIEY